ncbi:MAG: response regulator [Lachnospiraceae bacterium]|nr:response regulator [Lachnospiraceae bacterium]
MNDEKICAIIIDTDVKRVKEIKDILPDYIDLKPLKYSEAMNSFRSGIDGHKVELVIMDADDETGKSLTLFKYISEDPDRLNLKNTAVLLITQDEFSDHSFEYYDCGEPVFYSGELDESDFYLAVTEALEEADNRNYELDEPTYVEPVLSEEYIEAEAVIKEEQEKKEEAERESAKSISDKHELEIHIEYGAGQKLVISRAPQINQAHVNISNIHKISDANKVADLLKEDAPVEPSKPKILIVDYDENTLKAMKLFLTNYDVEMVNTNIKAIDYIVKNRVAVVAIEYNMNGVPGLSILKSIRNQPGGKDIKAFMIMGEKRSQFEMNHVLSATGVAGVITKPIVKKQLYKELGKIVNKVD